MNIHEYQAKNLLKKYGVSVPRGGVAYTIPEAEQVAKELGGPVYVVKSQIHAGGRGAGRFADNPEGKGGVRVVKSVEDVTSNAKEMLGHVLVTKQTGPAGKEVKRLYIEEGCDIARELYLGLLLDRATSRVTIMASTEGGMEIEEVAHNNWNATLRARCFGKRFGFWAGYAFPFDSSTRQSSATKSTEGFAFGVGFSPVAQVSLLVGLTRARLERPELRDLPSWHFSLMAGGNLDIVTSLAKALLK